MLRLVLPAILIVPAGCGPLQSPLPQRLEAEEQQKIDDAWSKSLAPVDRFDHQGLLDVMVGARAYELGIDTLEMRSEKRFPGGRAVMEVHFNRAKPEQDRFDVTIYDERGRLLRSERFDRREVEDTYRDLFIHGGADQPANDPRRINREARWRRIDELFPPNDGKK